MQSEQLIVIVGSTEPEELRRFYEDVVGLCSKAEFAAGAFATDETSPPCLIIELHSEVASSAKEPQRMLLSFLVGSVEVEQERLLNHGVNFVRPAYEEPDVGWFATFADLDGNYCQLVELM